MQTTIIISLLVIGAAIGLVLLSRWVKRENARIADIAVDVEFFDKERQAWQDKSKRAAIQRAIDSAKRETARARNSERKSRPSSPEDFGGAL